MLKHFPPAVWATAFAAFAFMGIGVVDPILPLIGRKMGPGRRRRSGSSRVTSPSWPLPC